RAEDLRHHRRGRGRNGGRGAEQGRAVGPGGRPARTLPAALPGDLHPRGAADGTAPLLRPAPARDDHLHLGAPAGPAAAEQRRRGLIDRPVALRRLGLEGPDQFDILTIRTLDTLQATVDGARAHFGIEVDVYVFAEEYDDPMVWDEIAQGHTLGMFQIETAAGTKLVRRFRPQSVLELSDIGALVRPGPMRSGLTEAYLRRRAGEEPVHYADPRLERFLAP